MLKKRIKKKKIKKRTKKEGKKSEVSERRMLLWMCGVTKLDKIRNERIRDNESRANHEVHERRLKWHGHVMRRDDDYVGRRAMDMKVQRRRKRGRPERRRLDKGMMKSTTMLRGGVCHRTSTPHKSGNKMKRKKVAGVITVVKCIFEPDC